MDDYICEALKRMILYRILCIDEINRELFAHFQRQQNVSKCWRKINGVWQIKDIAFVDDWTESDYETLTLLLKSTVFSSGYVAGAFVDGQLKGFTSVESALFGNKRQYLDLTSIHVSQDMRGKGIGQELFSMAKAWAKKHGAGKLYISAHSAIESQAFYRAMGCVEAEEYNKELANKEPCDCQLECEL